MKKLLLTLLFGVLLFQGSGAALASVGLPDYLRPDNLPNATRSTQGNEVPEDYAARGVQYIIGDIISVVLTISGVITVYFIANTGWWMIIAMGKGEQIDQQKRALQWEVLGLVFILISYIIMRFIVDFSVAVLQEAP